MAAPLAESRRRAKSNSESRPVAMSPAQDVHRRVRVLQRQLEVSLGAPIRQFRWSRPCCFQQVWIHALVDDMERRFSTVAAFAPGAGPVKSFPL